jgi:hypothetical protein
MGCESIKRSNSDLHPDLHSDLHPVLITELRAQHILVISIPMGIFGKNQNMGFLPIIVLLLWIPLYFNLDS